MKRISVCPLVVFSILLVLCAREACSNDNYDHGTQDSGSSLFLINCSTESWIDAYNAIEYGMAEAAGSRNFFGNTMKDGIWFYYPVADELSGEYLFLLSSYYLEEVDFYYIHEGTLSSESRSGIYRSETPHDRYSLYQVFPLSLETGQKGVLFNVRARETLVIANLESYANYQSSSLLYTSLVSIISGLFLGFLLVNLYFIFFHRETARTSLFFIFFIVFELLYEFSRLGTINVYLWPNNVYLIERFYLITLAFANLFGILLIKSFQTIGRISASVKKPSILLRCCNTILPVFVVVPAVFVVFFAAAPHELLQRVIFIGRFYQIATMIYLILLPLASLQQTDQISRVFFAGWLPGMVLYIIATLKAGNSFSYIDFNLYVLLGTFLITAANFISSGFRIREISRQKSRAEEELKEAGYQLMQSRSRPHFLMNTFSLLSGLIRSRSENADRVVELLAKDFTYYTRDVGKPLISIESEVNFIRNYIEILIIRFSGNLDVSFDCSIDDDFLIPPLSLQPLVENAVKYCLPNDRGCRCIKLELSCSAMSLTFIVENPAEDDAAAEIGRTHENILARLQAFYPRALLKLDLKSGLFRTSLLVEGKNG